LYGRDKGWVGIGRRPPPRALPSLTVPPEERAREEINRWSKLLREHRDRITAISIAPSSPRSVSPAEAYAALKELALEIRRPDYAWTLVDGDLENRRPISDAEVTDAIDWIECIALAIATVLG
jgi:hypothetical protein